MSRYASVTRWNYETKNALSKGQASIFRDWRVIVLVALGAGIITSTSALFLLDDGVTSKSDTQIVPTRPVVVDARPASSAAPQADQVAPVPSSTAPISRREPVASPQPSPGELSQKSEGQDREWRKNYRHERAARGFYWQRSARSIVRSRGSIASEH